MPWLFRPITLASAGSRSASTSGELSLSYSPGSDVKASALSACGPRAGTKGNSMPNTKKARGYSKKDLREVSDNPELTKSDFAHARPFSEVFPDLSASLRKGRGPNKSPTKKLVSLRLSPEVVEHFKSTGRAGNRG